jgi:hypothetical protein
MSSLLMQLHVELRAVFRAHSLCDICVSAHVRYIFNALTTDPWIWESKEIAYLEWSSIKVVI